MAVEYAILKLNSLRNQVGHNLGADISFDDLGPINGVLNVARPGIGFKAPIDAIEAFTTVACTWLIVPPKELQHLFTEAFSDVRL